MAKNKKSGPSKSRPKSAPAAPAPRRGSIKDTSVLIGLHILKAERQRLRRLAAELDITIQEAVLQGLDLLFEKYGRPPVARHKSLRGVRD